MAGLNLFKDGAIKTLDFSPWGGIDGFLMATGASNSDYVTLRGLVPWLNKAVNMTGNAVAQLPYYFDDGSERVIEEETAWGGVRNPQTLILKVASSLCSGRAYVMAETTNRAIVSLRYLSPTTVQPIFDSNGEIKEFKRQVNGKSEIVPLDRMIYFWLPDDTIEIGEAQLTPMRNAILPAQLIAAMDQSLKQYGERGFIPPTLLSAKGMTNKSDVEKTERWWNAFLRGWTSTTAKVMNAETMTATTLGAGMDELRGSYLEITRQQIENIAASFNIPLSLFLSNAANYATASSDRKTWYETGVFVSIYQTIEDTFSQQLFNKFGYDFEFDPDSIDAFQEDESAKAGSLATLSGAFATNPEAAIVAADVLGYELSEEQIAAIEALGVEEVAEPVTEEAVDEPEPMDMPSEEDNLIAAELMTWRKFAEKPRKRQFETKHIPAAIALQISAGLREAKTQDQIQAVFDSVVLGKVEAVQPVQDDSAIKALAASIDAMVMSGRNETVTPAPVFNLTMPDIKFTAQMPGQENTPIVFSPVIQPSDVMVKNDITVQPANAPVNNITVQPADVTIPPMPTEATITTDKLTGQKTLKVK